MAKKYLLETWREIAYNQEQTQKQYNEFWAAYFAQEKEVYKDILSNYGTVVSGTVAELAEKYNMEVLTMVGFLDGINDSLKKSNPIDKLSETTKVNLDYDAEKLYKNMVAAKADWLYGLEEWNSILSEEKKKELYKEEKMSGTVIKEKKVGRNEPCPCGSGKKYKHCCGR
jgi:uncharacterized protein YecA (UPF0149 family)